MLSNNTIVKAKNRSGGTLGYTIPDLNNVRRHYTKGEVKDITAEEVRKLFNTPGGYVMIRDYLLINNEELVKELLGTVEPEYYYSEADIVLLLKKGSLDELYDCLDFAPEGVIDLVKRVAIEIKLNDVSKREAILEKTGYDINSILKFKKEEELLAGESAEKEVKKRRVGSTSNEAPAENKAGPVRRVAAPTTK